MFLDQIMFKQQGIDLCRCYRHLDIIYAIDQCNGLGRQTRTAKITRDPLLQIFGFANIQYLAICAHHLINT